jgi:tRNA A-37 threonylcarbamoyl transferase component Bud32/tetratricopeptide (TPR) repeat protein
MVIPTGVQGGSCPKCAPATSWPGSEEGAKGKAESGAAGFEKDRIRYIGDYELGEEIARGGMGVVYKARQVSLNRLVALKMILAGQLADATDVKRFHAEAEAAANLDHPNIVAVYEAGEHQGQHYFSMRLVEGRSLAAIQRSEPGEPGPAACRSAATLLAKVARAVHHAHQRGVLHRDLKPGNILLDSQGEPHVTDFGLAKRVDLPSELTMSETVMGTPDYMSPEQAQAWNKGLTTATDTWSLGAILYRMLTGGAPFHRATAWETMQAVVNEEPVRPGALNRHVDRDLETICLKCLEKDPRRRYASASALADDLERWLNHEPIQARRSSRWERTLKWARRNPVPAGLLAVIILVGGVGFAGWRLAKEKAGAEASARDRAKALLDASDVFLAEQSLRETNRAHLPDLLKGLEQALARQSNNPILWNAWGVLLQRTNGWTNAYSAFTRAIALADSDPVFQAVQVQALSNRCAMLRRLQRFAEAGQDYRRYMGIPLPEPADRSRGVGSLPDYHLAPSVSLELGHTKREQGLYSGEWGDSTHVATNFSGQAAWYFGPGQNYAYCFVDPTFRWNLGSNVAVRVEYQTVSGNPVGLHYNRADHDYAEAEAIADQATNGGWRVAEFRLTEARFRNAQNGHADFRVYNYERGYYLRSIAVSPHTGDLLPVARPAIPGRESACPPNLLDLGLFYNVALTNNMHSKPGNDIAGLPQGRQVFGGVEFDVRGVIQLAGTDLLRQTGLNWPSAITNIPVRLKAARLNVLHGTAWNQPDGTRIGAYVLHYADGQTASLPIRYGQHLRDWWSFRASDEVAPQKALLAWTGENAAIRVNKGSLRLYLMTCPNPRPDVEIRSLDFISTLTQCAPFLLAITTE